MSEPRRHFAREFNQEAVQLVQQQGLATAGCSSESAAAVAEPVESSLEGRSSRRSADGSGSGMPSAA